MLNKSMSTGELLSWINTANSQGLNGLLRRLELTIHRQVFLAGPAFDTLEARNFELTHVLNPELTSFMRQAYFSRNGQAVDGVIMLDLDTGSHRLKFQVYDLVMGKKIYGHLITQENEKEENRSHEVLIKQILPILLSEVIKLNEIRETEKKFQDNFIFDLLHNNFSSLKTIVKQGQLWGWDFAKPHHLLIADIMPKDKNVPFSLLKSLICQVTAGQFKNPVVVEYDDQCLILVPETEEKNRQHMRFEIKSLGERILEAFAGQLPGMSISIGIGRFYSSATDLCRSYQEAKTALELGKLLGTNLGIYHFDDLGLIRLLAGISNDLLGDFCLEYLNDLIEYDRQNGTNLLETLEQYFNSSGDFNLTSKKLFIHPNTLRNRIKKIEEILHTSLEQYENIVNLWTAIIIYNLLGDMLNK